MEIDDSDDSTDSDDGALAFTRIRPVQQGGRVSGARQADAVELHKRRRQKRTQLVADLASQGRYKQVCRFLLEQTTGRAQKTFFSPVHFI